MSHRKLRNTGCHHVYEAPGSVGAGIERMTCSGCGAVRIQSSADDPITAVSPRLAGGRDAGRTQRVGLLASVRAS